MSDLTNLALIGKVLPVDGGENILPKAEDAAHTSGDYGLVLLAVRKDTAAALAGTDGNYHVLEVDANGRLHVNPGTVAVTGTFWQATQPVSLASLPALATGSNVVGAVQDAGPAAGAGTAQTPVHGDFSTAADVTAAPTSGQKWVVTDIVISTAAAAEVSLKEETSGTVVFGPILMPANGYAQFTLRGKLKLATANKKVQGFSSTNDHVTIQVSGYSEA